MRAEYQSPTAPTGPSGPTSPTGKTGPSGGEWPSVPTGPTPGHTGVPGSIGTVEWEGYPSPTYPIGYTKPVGWPRKFINFIARLFKKLF